MRKTISTWVSVLVLAGCASSAPSTPSPEEARQQVMATERAFAKTMADRDLAAFASFVAEDTVFFSGPKPLHGKQAVVEFWTRFYRNLNPPFSWEPTEVEVLASGELAYSAGPVYNSEGKLIARFNSIWRLEAPGRWRIIFDKGGEACNCAKP